MRRGVRGPVNPCWDGIVAPVIAFGCAVTDPGVYERCARPGIELAREADSAVLVQGTTGGTVSSIFRNYNLLLDSAADLDDLEALVIVHQDAEIVDPDACAKIRAALADETSGWSAARARSASAASPGGRAR